MSSGLREKPSSSYSPLPPVFILLECSYEYSTTKSGCLLGVCIELNGTGVNILSILRLSLKSIKF